MLPVVHRIAGGMYVFQQDSAPAHRARYTVQLLQQETPEFIAPNLWKTNSRDLNPVGQLLCLGTHAGTKTEDRTAVHDTVDLKQRLIETWSGIPQTVIDETIDEWGYDYEPVSKQTELRHFEHLL